ncbi:MAG: radical SAM protein [Candidatus Omnitrophica bacterium]|nr:radical SAM protein [Candidatus Omnitrophota bacterium]
MKILLINPPGDLERFLGKGRNFVPSFEPLGLLYISAVCKQYGYEVNVLDAFAQKMTQEDIKNTIAKDRPDVVGFTSFISNGGLIYELGRWIKSEYPGITVVFGNIHAGVYAEAYLRNNCCDIVVHGEGEYVFLKILENIKQGGSNFSDIPSISFLHNSEFITTSGPAVVENLSLLPLPDRDALKQDLYNISALSNMPYIGNKNRVAKHMLTSRGCLFSCFFCVVHNKKGQRFNGLDQVLNEIELLINKYQAEYIFFMDPLFISKKERVMNLCSEIKKRKLFFKWGCEGHINFVDRELITEMESAGCHDIAFGIESGVQRLLNNVRKGTRLEEINSAISLIKKNTRIKVSGLFILGLPGETYTDSLCTIKFAKELPLDMAQFSICVPYPGSPIFYELRNKGQIDTGIRDNGALDTSVWLRYSAYISFTPNEPIWVTPALNSELLKKLQKKALREFYFRPVQIYNNLKRVNFANLWSSTATFKDMLFEKE